jgi:hypothetical protein
VANPPISSSLIDFVFDLHRRSFDQRLFFVITLRRDLAAVVAVSETRRRRLLICYSRPAVDWIGIDSAAVGRRPLRSVPL